MGNADIFLRAPEPEDMDFMLSVENGDEAMNAGGVATGLYSKYQIRRFITESANDIFTDRQIRFMICLKPDSDPVGMIDVFDFSPRHSRAEVGIVVAEAFRRRGIATAALSCVCAHCMGRLGLHQLYAYIGEGNNACLRTFEKEGFEVAGLIKDWVMTGTGHENVWLVQKMEKS